MWINNFCQSDVLLMFTANQAAHHLLMIAIHVNVLARRTFISSTSIFHIVKWILSWIFHYIHFLFVLITLLWGISTSFASTTSSIIVWCSIHFCWIVHFCYKIYHDGIVKDVNMKMTNVNKWVRWCCERHIIKKLINAKKQTQCYNTKR